MLEILAVYTYELIPTLIIFLFFNPESLSFEEIRQKHKWAIRMMGLLIVVLSILLVYYYG